MAIFSLFEMAQGKTGRIDVPENSAKNNLPIGTVLQMNGYSNNTYVIVKNTGVSESFPQHGAHYMTVNIQEETFSNADALSLRYIEEKADNRIQTYITHETLTPDLTLRLYEAAKRKQETARAAADYASKEADRLEAIGRELFAKHIPADAKALIVACLEIDDCDSQTDYFATKHGETVILGYSMHTRDIFSEMRKHAAKIPETKHLAARAAVNGNGEALTETNKDWWAPADEHREKYSMGAGYYLKASSCYSTGWTISKERKWSGGWTSGQYIAMAKRCVF